MSWAVFWYLSDENDYRLDVVQTKNFKNTSGIPPRNAARILRTTIHRVCVEVLRIKLLAFGVLFGVGPEQDLERLPCVSAW